MIKAEYIQNKKTLDELKELIQKYLDNHKETEPIARLEVDYFQDEKGNFTNDGKSYIEVKKEIYDDGRWRIRKY